jgi:GAF domain-containing protein
MDCRVLGHPKAGRFQSYYGVPLLADNGELVGTVCHFDEEPITLEP